MKAQPIAHTQWCGDVAPNDPPIEMRWLRRSPYRFPKQP